MAVLSPVVIFYQSNPSPMSTGRRRRLQPIYKLMVMDAIVVVVISCHDIAFSVVKMVAVYLLSTCRVFDARVSGFSDAAVCRLVCRAAEGAGVAELPVPISNL